MIDKEKKSLEQQIKELAQEHANAEQRANVSVKYMHVHWHEKQEDVEIYAIIEMRLSVRGFYHRLPYTITHFSFVQWRVTPVLDLDNLNSALKEEIANSVTEWENAVFKIAHGVAE